MLCLDLLLRGFLFFNRLVPLFDHSSLVAVFSLFPPCLFPQIPFASAPSLLSLSRSLLSYSFFYVTLPPSRPVMFFSSLCFCAVQTQIQYNAVPYTMNESIFVSTSKYTFVPLFLLPSVFSRPIERRRKKIKKKCFAASRLLLWALVLRSS